jgi:hypothetical protein
MEQHGIEVVLVRSDHREEIELKPGRVRSEPGHTHRHALGLRENALDRDDPRQRAARRCDPCRRSVPRPRGPRPRGRLEEVAHGGAAYRRGLPRRTEQLVGESRLPFRLGGRRCNERQVTGGPGLSIASVGA